MSKSTNDSDNGEEIIIKKYANRRLYNTQSSSYITLDYLAKLTRDGRNFKVIDAKSGADITRSILTQIIMEEESNGKQMLPVGFLREIIAMYGNSMQSMMPQYLEASMEAFRDNQEKFQSAMKGSIANGLLAALTRQNMAMFKAATSAFTPASSSPKASSSKESAKKETHAETAQDDEIKLLKEQLAAMQDKINALSDDK